MEYKGTYLKYVATSTGAFSFNDHEWVVVFTCNGHSVTFTKKNVEGGYELSCDKPGMGMKMRDDGSWVFLLDTSDLGPGRITAAVYADIPDRDFDPDRNFDDLPGIRREIRRYSLITITTI